MFKPVVEQACYELFMSSGPRQSRNEMRSSVFEFRKLMMPQISSPLSFSYSKTMKVKDLNGWCAHLSHVNISMILLVPAASSWFVPSVGKRQNHDRRFSFMILRRWAQIPVKSNFDPLTPCSMDGIRKRSTNWALSFSSLRLLFSKSVMTNQDHKFHLRWRGKGPTNENGEKEQGETKKVGFHMVRSD